MSKEKWTLPEGWKWVKLKKVGVFEAGGTPAKNHDDYWKGKTPFVTGADITDMYINKSHARAFLSESGLHSGKTVICKPDTVLIVTRTRVGRAGIASEVMGASQDITAFHCDPAILPEFLCRYFNDISQHLIDNARGATIQGLTREFVENLAIPLPPLAEQQRITTILNEQIAAVDSARNAAESRLEAIQALPVACLQQCFHQQSSQYWQTDLLGNLCNIVRGSSPRPKGDPRYYGGNVPRLMVEDVSRDHMYVKPNIDFLTKEGALLSRPMKKGDVVIVVSGSPGVPAILDIDACIHDGFVGLRNLQKDRVLPEFLFYFLKHSKDRTDVQATGAIFRNLTTHQVSRLTVPFPPLSEQKRITSLLNTQMTAIDRARSAAESELATINALPAALLRRAFAGEL